MSFFVVVKGCVNFHEMTSVLSMMGGGRVLVGEMAWMTVPRCLRSQLHASFHVLGLKVVLYSNANVFYFTSLAPRSIVVYLAFVLFPHDIFLLT